MDDCSASTSAGRTVSEVPPGRIRPYLVIWANVSHPVFAGQVRIPSYRALGEGIWGVLVEAEGSNSGIW